MCTTTVNGVLVVREGVRRLSWAHELEGSPPPLHAHQWQIAGLWPDRDTRRRIRARLDRGEPVLVILDREPAVVELPVEHVRRIPQGVAADMDRDAGVLTLEVPVLDWLDPEERARGRAFADDVRKMLDRTPKFLLAPLIVEDTRRHNGTALTFAYPTRSSAVGSALLAEVVDQIAARSAGLEPRSAVAGHGLSIVTTVA
jgi:hypothetical protein